jgi:DNA repair photolyase
MPGWVRSVRTPEFAGITFHEVVARSVLNRPSAAGALPFSWTVNPYRGCSHACTYCLAGDTPILMADGRARPLSGLRAGDRIFGTVRHGRLRRYTVTTVLDHWSTVRPAYRVTLADGTWLIASADHRLLTDLGWRFVADVAERRWPGRHRRPHLSPGSMVVGTGAFAVLPKDSTDYRLGYLCGIVRSSGRPGSFRHPSGGRHRVRLATLEFEALTRVRAYLAAAGVATDRFLDRSDRDPRHEVLTVRARDSELGEVRRLIRWPATPSEQWRRGFLAGAYDVGGHRPREYGDEPEAVMLRAEVPEVVAQIVAACRQLGFDATMDGVARVVVLGGLTERLRYLHTVDPACGGGPSLTGAVLGTEAVLAVRAVEPLGLRLPMFDIATGTGDFIANGVVSHNCFARNSHTYLDLDAGADFDREIVVKVNTPEALAAQLRSPRWTREPVALGTNTDPYQRAEGRYRLMPGVIEAFSANATPFSVLTKGSLLARDLPLLVAAAAKVRVGLGVSIAMLDRRLSASVEPGTPTPQARLDLVRRVTDAGLACAVMVAPVLPGLTDGVDQLDALLGEVKAAGATGATVLALHLRPGAREWYRAWLAREHPDLVGHYDRIYGCGSYADRRYRAWLARRAGPLVRKHGLQHAAGSRIEAGANSDRGQLPVAEQMTLL